MKGTQLKFDRTWVVGDQIGSGGFGRVYVVKTDGMEAVAKLVPKAAGADRELLFVDLPDVRNVVPIIDNGEYEDYWVLVMPRAEMSLRDHLEQSAGLLTLDELVEVLKDIGDALSDLDGRVVHRDLKPENVLRLGGHWCLADFGISRYAEATTAPDTQKFALSPPYAAPERWRGERATGAADIYAIGVMAFEMLAGSLPFPGPSFEEFREQHLHSRLPVLTEAPAPVAALVEECLYKAPGARPPAANLRARLDRAANSAGSLGLSRLQEAYRAEVQRRGEVAQQQSEAQTETERRQALAAAAVEALARISAELQTVIREAAPSASSSAGQNGSWTLRLGPAELELSAVTPHAQGEWGRWNAPAFDVVCVASLSLTIPPDQFEYVGRSHSLWYGDIQDTGRYGWYEAAFMISPLMPRRARQEPFSLDPGVEAAKAVWNGMAEYQLAWPFTALVVGELDEFIDRWAGWFAEAAEGRLGRPSTMPERQSDGSWRLS